MGNGAKAQQKRDRNAKDAKGAGASQLKTNAASLTIQCDVCKATFQGTSKIPVLQQHVDSKHPKSTVAACFPNVSA
ncbi:hypothetical protein B9479_002646 [Cryptococcus floricola]|uniref:Uncharacterized protein n=1 Tax=Cryptococcus floricola TaxID=2591691 RepID=A0A5D3AZD8_9TREE|nr:hypothetical protein B9479_002646 [Cryptococcus floricola]